MKSSGRHVGSINLRGKRSRVLNCQCCVALDLRDKVLENEARREMQDAQAGVTEGRDALAAREAEGE